MGVGTWFKDKFSRHKSNVTSAVSNHYQENYRQPALGFWNAHSQVKNANTWQEREAARQERAAHGKQFAENLVRNTGIAATVGLAGAAIKGAISTKNYARDKFQSGQRPLIDAVDLLSFVALLYYFGATVFHTAWQFRLVFNLVFWLSFYFHLDIGERSGKTFSWLVIIFILDMVVLPQLNGMASLASNKWIKEYAINILIVLPWFWFFQVNSDRRSLMSKIFYIFIIVYFVSILLDVPAVAITLENTQITADQSWTAGERYKRSYEFYKTIVTNTGAIMRQGTNFWKLQMKYATGDIYTGRVDENQQTILGVYLKNIKPSDPEFYQDDTISVWGLLEAKSLEDNIDLKLNCYYGNKDKDGNFPIGRAGITKPSNEDMPQIFNNEQLDIDCRFPYHAGMQEGSNKVTVQADFNFETMAYLKTYFIDRDRLRSMQAQGINPLTEYGITETKPVSKYTNGPVMIGIGSVEPPIGIADRYSVTPRLGITLQTNTGWKGKIKQVNELIVMVPQSMRLDVGYCTEFKELTGTNYVENCTKGYEKYKSKQLQDCVAKAGLDPKRDIVRETGKVAITDKQAEVTTCMESYCSQEVEGYVAYKLNINEKNEKLFSNIGFDSAEKQFKTFSCRVIIDNPQSLLDDTPISVQYYRVKARYVYEIEESTNIIIKDIRPKDYTWVAPTKEGPANVPFVHSNYKTLISDTCKNDEYARQLFKNEQDCYCYLTAFVNAESSGNPRAVSPAGAVGLMQVMPKTAEGVVKRYQLEPGNLYDPAYNMKVAVRYLHQLYTDEKYVNHDYTNMIAAYNGGPGSCKPSTSCVGTCEELQPQCQGCVPGETCKVWQCTVNGGYAETRKYVPKVKASVETCQNMNLPDFVEIKPEENKDKKERYSQGMAVGFDKKVLLGGNYVVTITDRTQKVRLIDAEGNPLPENVRVSYDVKLGLVEQGGGGEGYIEVASQSFSDPLPDSWYEFSKYPFVSFKFGPYSETGLTMDFISWEKTIVNTDYLFLNAMDEGSKRKLTPVWYTDDGYYAIIWAYYSGGSITLFNDEQQPFCNVPWSQETVYAYCDDPRVYNIMITNIETITRTEAGKQPSAKVQVKYDPLLQHSCCNSCTGCGILQCATCEKCKVSQTLKDVWVKSYSWGATCQRS